MQFLGRGYHWCTGIEHSRNQNAPHGDSFGFVHGVAHVQIQNSDQRLNVFDILCPIYTMLLRHSCMSLLIPPHLLPPSLGYLVPLLQSIIFRQQCRIM